MSSQSTYSSLKLLNENEIVDLFAQALAANLKNAPVEEITTPRWIRELDDYDDRCKFPLDIEPLSTEIMTFGSTVETWDNYCFAATVWLKKNSGVEIGIGTQPLVDPKDIEDIKNRDRLSESGIRTTVSDKLKNAQEQAQHKVLRAMSVAQLMWQESYELAIQDEQ